MSSYHPRKNIEAVCLVDIDDKKLSEVLKDHYGCKIIPRNDKESYPNKDLVYIFAHFDTIEFQELLDSFIISSTLVWNMYRKNLPLPFPRPKRPLYCEKLSNFNFILRASNEGERVSWCTIVRYMGGHVKREPSATTNFLITDQAKGKAFRQCVSLGQKVLLSSWLHECWEHKDDFDFDPFSVEMINKHRIGVFERLKIFVYGFDDTEDDDIKQNIIRNRSFFIYFLKFFCVRCGKIVDDVSDATHCVINTSKDLNQLPQLDNQRLVTNEWVWTSINIENCANEESYHPGAPFSQNFTSGPSLSAVTTTDRSVSEGANSVYEAGVGDKTHKTSKAFQVCLEIYETEVSYLNALKLLVGVKEELDLLLDEGVVLLHKSEVSLIFGKILPIMTVHQGIIARLKVILDNWKSDADVAQVWIDSFDDLNRVYAPYSNTHDTAVDALGAADKANPRVHAFLRVC
ncbi:BRCA1 protein [Dictyocaulus viviparus]|uniref:BRCA1 protein n=1 Tax=Dictyocaulus viviparus TaxID=29172 RepID=A0A0D8XFC3_DICVI|nr:BRCA1 protein [Dictyocaulus viviparus]